MQSIRITCIQRFASTDAVTGTGEIESNEMTLEPWKFAITAAAAASGFDIRALRNFILEWAEEIEGAA